MSTFHERLRHFRERLGLNAKDFAAQIGVKYTTYTAYENQGREPKYDTLIRIAAALHVSIDKLLGYQVDEWEAVKGILTDEGYTITPLDTLHHFFDVTDNATGYQLKGIQRQTLIRLVHHTEVELRLSGGFSKYLRGNFNHEVIRQNIADNTPPSLQEAAPAKNKKKPRQ